jgi:hypothetical protein
MLQSRHFAGKPLTGKGLKRFPGTLHSGVQYPPAHHLGVRWQNKKQKPIGSQPRFNSVHYGQAIIAERDFPETPVVDLPNSPEKGQSGIAGSRSQV